MIYAPSGDDKIESSLILGINGYVGISKKPFNVSVRHLPTSFDEDLAASCAKDPVTGVCTSCAAASQTMMAVRV